MNILITGATGLIGSEIVKQCHKKGYNIHYLTTNKSKIVSKENYKGFYWNPSLGEIDERCLEGIDGIINLSGTSIAKRWTDSYKKEIIASRVKSIQVLNNALKKHPLHTLKTFVSASGIAIYPNSLTDYYNSEVLEIDNSYIGNVTSVWEKATNKLSSNNFSVAKIRIGLVLSKNGGALPQMTKPIRYNLGAVFGSGLQWQSWIHIEDIAAMFLYVIENQMDGVYNGVAPNPITNSKLIKEIALALKKRLFLPNIPKIMMKLILGEMSYILFSSQRVSSKGIQDLGFQFKYSNIRFALLDLLNNEGE